MTDDASPFHDGERQVQERLGAREQAERIGARGIRAAMPDQHREFFAGLAYVFVATLDARGRPWSSLLTGPQGFISSPDPQTLVIGAAPATDDPARDNFRQGSPIGVLGVDLATRRRNRMNGRIVAATRSDVTIAVDQSFGNCPQYIQGRTILQETEILQGAETLAATPDGPEQDRAQSRARGAAREHSVQLDAEAVALLRRADTAFVASASANADGPGSADGADSSHRGGRPGFLRLEIRDGRARITIPDFAGNRLYNTLGNISVRPRAGLLVPDFETGAVLSLTGAAEILWDAQGDNAFEGAERFIAIDVEEAWTLPGAMPWRWSAPDPARQIAGTGAWRESWPES